MIEKASADPSNRLPWLHEPTAKAAPRRTWAPIVLTALAAAAAGAVGSLALQRIITPPEIQVVESSQLPPPMPMSAEPTEPVLPTDARTTAMTDRESVPTVAAPSVRKPIATEGPKLRVSRAHKAKARANSVSKSVAQAANETRSQAHPVVTRSETTATYDPRAWNSGIPGRIIQLGAFDSSTQASSQWNRIYYRYPLLRPLPPRVVRTQIRGRTFYRLQLGTFSHAHSELLCQRLRAVGEGCLVLGLSRQG